ncbi:MAG: two-component sensor histidine kinase [Massilia sp.]|nr:two-component sensor histidine kinase [Massilia sp.]
MARWQALSAESRETFWRSLQTLNATRIVIALVLLLYLGLDSKGARAHSPHLYAQTCAAYLVVALLFGMLTLWWRRRFLFQLGSQIACDIGLISLLYLSAGGASTGLAILYLFPLAGAAILAPLVLALFSASLVTLILIGESVWRVLVGLGQAPLLQSGVYGASFFATVLLVSRLAAKLIGQEELAARRGADLKIQQAINRIVMADVGDGILVVGSSGHVFTSNPAAQRMLGLSGEGVDFRLADMAALAPIAQAFSTWLGFPPDAAAADGQGAFVIVKPAQDDGAAHGHGHAHGHGQGPVMRSVRPDLAAHLKLRFARVDTADHEAGRCVIFLQDVTAIENQAQQLKLASMGRLTASIAHEVRNPLSAIGHATALLAEDLAEPSHARLLKIVGDNVARVNRMVEDILQLSRKVQPHSEPLVLGALLAELRTEFSETHALADDMIVVGGAADATNAPVRFDALHLREVVVNLLTNAIRYASATAGSIRLFVVSAAPGRMELHVQDDGPGITPEVRAHLFEPFYTTSSKGTGLGLYLARELCLNNDAMLDYEYRMDQGGFAARKPSGRFVITFAQPSVALPRSLPPPLPLSPIRAPSNGKALP